MTGLRTNEALLRALKESSSPKLSHKQMAEQHISFVMGSLDEENHMTRDQVKHVLDDQDFGQLNLK